MRTQNSDLLEQALDICNDTELHVQSTPGYEELMNHRELINKLLNPESDPEKDRLLEELDEVYTNLYNMQLMMCAEALISEAYAYDGMTK